MQAEVYERGHFETGKLNVILPLGLGAFIQSTHHQDYGQGNFKCHIMPTELIESIRESARNVHGSSNVRKLGFARDTKDSQAEIQPVRVLVGSFIIRMTRASANQVGAKF